MAVTSGDGMTLADYLKEGCQQQDYFSREAELSYFAPGKGRSPATRRKQYQRMVDKWKKKLFYWKATPEEKTKASHMLGFLMGNNLAHKLLERSATKKVKNRFGKREKWLDWKSELEEVSYVVVCHALRPDLLSMIAKELRRKGVGEKLDPTAGFPVVTAGFVHEGVIATADGVSLENCPVLSGFLDGLKETMGWLKKFATDVYFMRPRKASLPQQEGVDIVKGVEYHTDIESSTVSSAKPGDEAWPFTLYLCLEKEKTATILHDPDQKPASGRGIVALPKVLEVPPGAVLLWDTVRFHHHKNVNDATPPQRCNILLHGLPEYAVVMRNDQEE
jgi:hypothetical protein